MTIHKENASTRSVLLAVADELEKMADEYASGRLGHTAAVGARVTLASRQTAQECRKLANGIDVRTLLDHCE